MSDYEIWDLEEVGAAEEDLAEAEERREHAEQLYWAQKRAAASDPSIVVMDPKEIGRAAVLLLSAERRLVMASKLQSVVDEFMPKGVVAGAEMLTGRVRFRQGRRRVNERTVWVIEVAGEPVGLLSAYHEGLWSAHLPWGEDLGEFEVLSEAKSVVRGRFQNGPK